MQLILTLLSLCVTLANLSHAQCPPETDYSSDSYNPCAQDQEGREPLPSITRTAAQSSAAAVAQAQAHALQSTVSHGNSVGIAYGSPNPSRPDPCGPPVQPSAPAGSLSTCTQNVSVSDLSAHSSYGLNCWNDANKPAIDSAACKDAMYVICNHISTGGELYNITDRWIWSTSGSLCTFGYWLPAGGAPPPSFDRCIDQIYSPMQEHCAGTEFNVGSVNIASGGLPDGLVNGSVGTGLPVQRDYPSYVMFPLGSHYGINGE